jgi:(p)ppGpp synthase/HD superfamily hydrolase
MTEGWPLTRRFVEALAYATEVHAGQSRKGTPVPYVSHVLAVCSLVLEDGGVEDEAIAALLHDAVEDGGGRPRLDDIRRRFGDRVAEIVWACSDTDETPKPPWKERKTRYIAHVREAGPEARRVSCADKLHNARSILRDYRVLGERVWDRFSASAEENLWYYRELVLAFRQPDRSPLVGELERVVSELEAERNARVGGAPKVTRGEAP